jgi:hypothetical protein
MGGSDFRDLLKRLHTNSDVRFIWVWVKKIWKEGLKGIYLYKKTMAEEIDLGKIYSEVGGLYGVSATRVRELHNMMFKLLKGSMDRNEIRGIRLGGLGMYVMNPESVKNILINNTRHYGDTIRFHKNVLADEPRIERSGEDRGVTGEG